MNSPSILVVSAPAAAGAVATQGADASSPDAFSAALAGSLAMLEETAAETVPLEDAADAGSLAEAETPELSDVLQWLTAPPAAPPAQTPETPNDGSAVLDDLQGRSARLLAAAAARLAGAQADSAAMDAADLADANLQGDGLTESIEFFPAAGVKDGAAPAVAGAVSAALPAGTGAAQMLSNPLSVALIRDGAVATQATAANTTAPGRNMLHETVGTARWAQELGSRLVMMSVRGQQEGSLTLTPEHLGPLEIQISVSKDTANVWFGAQHADTRAALTEALPRLRELLAASGLTLGQSGVSEQSPHRQSQEADAGRVSGTAADPVEDVVEPAWRTRQVGLIDTYA